MIGDQKKRCFSIVGTAKWQSGKTRTTDAPLHQTQERRVHRVRNLEFVRVLAQEEHTVVDELANDEPEDLAEVATRDEFLDIHEV